MNKNKYLTLIFSSLALLCLGMSTYAQRVWETKRYEQWSDSEALQIIVASPWAKLTHEYYLDYSVQIRLYSALPIRQALVRLGHTRPPSAHTVAERAKFDSEEKDNLACLDCAKYYIVTLLIIPTVPRVQRELKDLTLKDLEPYVFLTNDRGDRRSLANFVPPLSGGDKAMFRENAVFYFERLDERGKPLLALDQKKLYFQIGNGVLMGKLLPNRKVTFDVPNLIYNGEIIF